MLKLLGVHLKQMRQILVIVIPIALLLLSFKEWTTIGAFKLNQQEIADQFCVNKFKKGSCCEGSCFLSNLLIDLNDEEGSAVNFQENERTFFFKNTTDTDQSKTWSINQDKIPYHSVFKLRLWCETPLQPPQWVVC
jgi:hypothetical protein